jgi:putative phage-type endonuclease
MKIIDCEQRTPEWFEARKGVLTASKFGKWLTDPTKNKTSNKALQGAICGMLGDLSGESEPPDRDSWEMKRGRELEPEARAAYETITGYKVTEVGFILHDCGRFGCSPDGLCLYKMFEEVSSNPCPEEFSHGLEIKCPVPKTHIKYLFDGGVPDEYLCQVHGSMAVTGLTRWDFMSYCPELPPLLITVERDEFTEAILDGLLEVAKQYEIAFEKLKQLWKKYTINTNEH